MINFHSAPSFKNFIIIGILLGGCYAKPAKNDLKINIHYWTYTGQEKCVLLAGEPHCFLNEDIDASNFITDSAAGFLFLPPTSDPDLIECAKTWYRLTWDRRRYPHIHMTVGETSWPAQDSHSDGRVHKDKYWHVRDIEMGRDDVELGRPSRFDKPRQYIEYFGEKCLKLNRNDLSTREVLCYGGRFDKGEPAYFWGCNRDGETINPACRYELYYKKLEYTITSSKKCAPFMNNKLRDFAITFVEEGRKRAHYLSTTKRRQPIE